MLVKVVDFELTFLLSIWVCGEKEEVGCGIFLGLCKGYSEPSKDWVKIAWLSSSGEVSAGP